MPTSAAVLRGARRRRREASVARAESASAERSPTRALRHTESGAARALGVSLTPRSPSLRGDKHLSQNRDGPSCAAMARGNYAPVTGGSGTQQPAYTTHVRDLLVAPRHFGRAFSPFLQS
eukprot:scaffold106_cov246-Pinguiococcus_pyrenoidosus.AAC.20